MRSTITRTLVQTKIHGAKIEFVDGNPVATPIEPIIVYGNVSQGDAKRMLAKEYGKNDSLVVAKIESEEKHFEISVEDFVKHAKIVDSNPEEN